MSQETKTSGDEPSKSSLTMKEGLERVTLPPYPSCLFTAVSIMTTGALYPISYVSSHTFIICIRSVSLPLRQLEQRQREYCAPHRLFTSLAISLELLSYKLFRLQHTVRTTYVRHMGQNAYCQLAKVPDQDLGCY